RDVQDATLDVDIADVVVALVAVRDRDRQRLRSDDVQLVVGAFEYVGAGYRRVRTGEDPAAVDSSDPLVERERELLLRTHREHGRHGRGAEDDQRNDRAHGASIAERPSVYPMHGADLVDIASASARVEGHRRELRERGV